MLKTLVEEKHQASLQKPSRLTTSSSWFPSLEAEGVHQFGGDFFCSIHCHSASSHPGNRPCFSWSNTNYFVSMLACDSEFHGSVKSRITDDVRKNRPWPQTDHRPWHSSSPCPVDDHPRKRPNRGGNAITFQAYSGGRLWPTCPHLNKYPGLN